MLVLTRKKNESLQIDSEICVTVISIARGRVKLGISAPDHVRIIRNELLTCGLGIVMAQEPVGRPTAK